MEEVGWIAGLEAAFYSEEDAIPRELLEDWYRKNSGGFFILRRNDGEKVGHVDFLSLRPGVLQALLEGEIVEREIRGEDLFTVQERDAVRDVYLESIIISENGPFRRAARQCLLNRFIQMVGNLGDPGQVKRVHAIAATDKGASFLGRMGFAVAKSGRERKDQHDFYTIRFEDLIGRTSEIR